MVSGAGTIIGRRFRLVELLGQGGMGRVWRGRDEFLNRDVAVKEVLLSADLAEGDRAALAARAVREAQSAGRLNHPGVVTIHDVVEHDGAPWIVMEYVPGPSLAAQVAAGGPLPWWQAAEIGAKVADALAHAHAAGIVHRDMKPDNILIAGDRVVITDFGIARIADSTCRLTSTGAVIGTPHYMAPEQLEGSQVGPPADMWSFGATLYAIVEGRPPFDGPTLTAVVSAILARDPAPPSHAGPLSSLITQLLDKSPVTRPGAAVAAQALRGALETTAAVLPSHIARPVTQQARGREPATETVSRGNALIGPASPFPSLPSPGAVQPAGRRRPLYLAGGAVLAVLIAVIALVVAKPDGGGAGTPDAPGAASSEPASAAAAGLTSQVANVPASVTDKVAGGGVSAGSFVPAPTGSAVQSAATAMGSYFAEVDGKPLTAGGKPEILYMGAQYCPFCGAESWAVINALSRFGTFTGLRTISSSSTDSYPHTPSFTFYGSKYASSYISFTSVEEYTNYRQGNSASSSAPYAKLQTPTPAQSAVARAYDPEGSIPFIDLGGKYVDVGNIAPLTPQLLAGRTWAQVAAAMNDPSSPIGRAEIGNANYLTAAVCELTGDKPATACTPVVKSLERRL